MIATEYNRDYYDDFTIEVIEADKARRVARGERSDPAPGRPPPLPFDDPDAGFAEWPEKPEWS